MLDYAPLHVRVSTPRLELVAATDTLLEQLQVLVRDGKAMADPPPYDDPMSLYEPDPKVRLHTWLRGIWSARGSATPDSWRLSFAVVVDECVVGMQDVLGLQFGTHKTVTSFSWLSSTVRRAGLGTEMRHAILHRAFDGMGALEASSDAFVDNLGSNRVSEALGYQPNGVEWATRNGQPGLLQRWRLTRSDWLSVRRTDIQLYGVDACKAALGLT